jgi:hypothetical protein
VCTVVYNRFSALGISECAGLQLDSNLTSSDLWFLARCFDIRLGGGGGSSSIFMSLPDIEMFCGVGKLQTE